MGKLIDKISNLCNKIAEWTKEHQDKVLHFLLGFAFTMFVCILIGIFNIEKRALFFAFFPVIFLEVIKEIVDYIRGGGYAESFKDFAFTLLGALTAQALYVIILISI